MTWRQKTGLEQFWFNFGQFWSENWCDCQARETVQLLPRRCLCGIWYLGHPWTNDDLFLVLKLGQLRCWIGGQLSICWHWYIHFWWPVTGTSGFFSINGGKDWRTETMMRGQWITNLRAFKSHFTLNKPNGSKMLGPCALIQSMFLISLYTYIYAPIFTIVNHGNPKSFMVNFVNDTKNPW